jgi:hypothetical protein
MRRVVCRDSDGRKGRRRRRYLRPRATPRGGVLRDPVSPPPGKWVAARKGATLGGGRSVAVQLTAPTRVHAAARVSQSADDWNPRLHSDCALTRLYRLAMEDSHPAVLHAAGSKRHVHACLPARRATGSDRDQPRRPDRFNGAERRPAPRRTTRTARRRVERRSRSAQVEGQLDALRGTGNSRLFQAPTQVP